jgi:hypothetical protein
MARVRPSASPLRGMVYSGVDVPVPQVAELAVSDNSLGARRVGSIALAVAMANDTHVLLVPDDAVRAARTLLWAETAGAEDRHGPFG